MLLLSATPSEAQHRGHNRSEQPRTKLDPAAAGSADRTSGDSAVIIEFNDETGAADLIRENGGRAGRRLGILNARVSRVPNRWLRRLANNPKVKRISIDRAVEGMVGRTAVTTGARAVQELMGYTGAGVGVAIIDSGVINWHDDLTLANGQGQRVTRFVDFVNGFTQPYDDWGHGTHVAGIVAGNGYDTGGTRTAMAPGANIIALKALDANGHGTISSIIAALDYAVAHRDELNIRVINMSLGAGVYESYETDPLTLAAKRAVDAGIVVVAAAGNIGKSANGLPQYGAITAPGNAPWVITVGASSSMGTARRQDDTIADYSSRGPTMIDYLAKPDLVAPGSGTVSLANPLSAFYSSRAQALLPGFLPSAPDAPYLALSGTSMSTPVVAGAVALMLQANPALTPNLVKAVLQFTAQEYPGYDALTQGAGFLNARGAVVLAEYFRDAQAGSHYPSMTGWSRQILWGNMRARGGVLTPGGTAWGDNVVWGNAQTADGDNIVWGENCIDSACDNVVWGNNIVWGDASDDNIVWGNIAGGDNIVWGNTDNDNIVWGNADGDNIVWGNGQADNIVWGDASDDNIVWGDACAGVDCDNVVWGNSADNVVWGNAAGDNVVWGNSSDDNIVWGNSDNDNIVWGNADSVAVILGDERADLATLPSSLWDRLFPLDAPPLTETSEAGAPEEPSAPLPEDPTAPAIEEPSEPAVEEPSAPPVEEPSAPTVDSPWAPSVDGQELPPEAPSAPEPLSAPPDAPQEPSAPASPPAPPPSSTTTTTTGGQQ